MGMYTELSIGVELKKGTPQQVIDTLEFMVNGPGGESLELEAAAVELEAAAGFPLWILRSGGSYYFDGLPHHQFYYDGSSKSWYLTAANNIKNCEGAWERFLAWLAPHIETEGYFGTYRYEEDEIPTLLMAKGGEVIYLAPCPPPRERS